MATGQGAVAAGSGEDLAVDLVVDLVGSAGEWAGVLAVAVSVDDGNTTQ